MKRALPVVVLSVAGLIPVWRYEPSAGDAAAEVAEPAARVPENSTRGPSDVDAAPGTGASPSDGRVVVKGSALNTEKGPLQVEVTFEGDRITAVRMLRRPPHPQTAGAVPRLIAQTLQEQTADVDTVSGATITSEAYRQSLQAAIDARG